MLIANLVILGYGDYEKVCNMEFGNALMTFLIHNLSNYEEYMNFKLDKEINKIKNFKR